MDETLVSRLESWGESRRVVQLEIDLGESGIKYSPGDSLGICVPNQPKLVEAVASRLEEIRNDKACLETMVNSRKAPGIKSINDILRVSRRSCKRASQSGCIPSHMHAWMRQSHPNGVALQ